MRAFFFKDVNASEVGERYCGERGEEGERVSPPTGIQDTLTMDGLSG
jgi:hypothetical protein